MMRKTLIAAAAFVGLAVAGSVAGATPASAGYACGPWNGWCSWYGGSRYWGGYRHRHWDGDRHRGYSKKYYKGGKNKHAQKRNNKRNWR
jgi:hypothetical protein